METVVALQFLGTLAQVSVTIFAVYLALITYILQDKKLWKKVKKSKVFLLSFVFTCASYSLLLTLCFVGFGILGFGMPISDWAINGFILMFVVSLIGLFANFIDVLQEKSSMP